MKIFKSLISLCAIIGLLVTLTGCPTVANREETKTPHGMVNFSFFDTVSYVYSYKGDSKEKFEENSNGVFGILGEYHRLFDIYYEYSGVVNLCTLNKNAGGEAMCSLCSKYNLEVKRMKFVFNGDKEAYLTLFDAVKGAKIGVRITKHKEE